MSEFSASMPAHSRLFETIPCPLCGSPDFEVKLRSTYPPTIEAEERKRMFRASSDRQLLGRLVQRRSCTLVYVNPHIRSELIVSGYFEAEDPPFTTQNSTRIKPFWPALPFGYIAHRAAPYAPILAALPRIVGALRLSSIQMPYNIGQTLFVSKVRPAP